MSTYSVTPPVTPERKPSDTARIIMNKLDTSSPAIPSSKIPLGNSSNYLLGRVDGVLHKVLKSPALNKSNDDGSIGLRTLYKSLIYSGNYTRFEVQRDSKEHTLQEILGSLQECVRVGPHVTALSHIFLFPSKPSVDILSYKNAAEFACTRENEYLLLSALPAIVRGLLNKPCILPAEKNEVSFFFST